MVHFRRYGLAPAGKVKLLTPHVPASEHSSNSSHKYNGGRKKLRKHFQHNNKYKSGAHRLVSSFEPPNQSSSSLDNEEHGTPHYLSNSEHKFNTLEGMNRLEFQWTIVHEKRLQIKAEAFYNRNNKNHKKWHRNHPKDGFYQLRQVFEAHHETNEEEKEDENV
ncbi:hypothetical protein C9374_011131 [Naegleria lovaniensis]|uniref:Uncharacterized protein n=1 Tax=Naegleria lovaniensis TaxID=51637 RepID=A0AA88GEC7_NAELO|nr:uncharacterized protein C9374_011131 [Naegleria lovaniensis]KAG2374052.1 hypothetical protein C9374_011131 [Naegleria lovaniensis]